MCRRIGAVVGLVLALLPRAGHGADATPTVAWFSARIPVGLHLGSPNTNIESGVRADLLFVRPWSAPKGSPELPPAGVPPPRFGVGPLLEFRTLGISNVGIGGGIVVAGFTGGRAPLGVSLAGGVSRWLVTDREGSLSINGALSLQIRSATEYPRFEWTSTASLYIRGANSVSGSERELTIGLELGSVLLEALVAMRFGNRD